MFLNAKKLKVSQVGFGVEAIGLRPIKPTEQGTTRSSILDPATCDTYTRPTAHMRMRLRTTSPFPFKCHESNSADAATKRTAAAIWWLGGLGRGGVIALYYMTASHKSPFEHSS
jgi:hypothetical protein